MQRIKLLFILLMSMFFVSNAPGPEQQQLSGAWERTSNGQKEQWLFADGYCSYTVYSKESKRFGHTMGGPFRLAAGKLEIDREFDSADSSSVNKQLSFTFSINKDVLTLERNGIKENWQMLDGGKASLSGNWHITKRMQEGRLQTIHQTGTRKTVKLLTASRFQWVAIDPAVKGFYGTGGGAYTFKDGVYTEHIEFFSRDSSRVGSSLSFAGKLNDDGWHHSGKSSRGENIYEVWNKMHL